MSPEEEKKKRLRKLKYKSKYIDLEFEETSEILAKARKEWVEAIAEYCKKNKVENPLTTEKGKQKESTKQEEIVFSSSQIKDLYRKIALKTHPDKLTDYNEEEVKKRSEIYTKAAKAKKNKDVDAMLKIATELEIDTANLDMRCIDLLDKQLQEKEVEANKMRTDIAWQWYHSGDFKRNFIISKICPKPEEEV